QSRPATASYAPSSVRSPRTWVTPSGTPAPRVSAVTACPRATAARATSPPSHPVPPSSSTSIHPPCHVGGYDDRTPPPRVRRPHPPPTPSPGARRDPPGSELVPGCRTRTVHAPSSARRYEFAGDARGWGVGP